MAKIFGEEHFYDIDMIKAKFYQDIKRTYDDHIMGEVLKGVASVDVKIDKPKLERWLRLCQRLEYIDQAEIEDIAIKKKSDEKDHQIAVLEQRWKDLKEFIHKDHDWNLERGNNDCALGQRWVLEKMQELEQEFREKVQ